MDEMEHRWRELHELPRYCPRYPEDLVVRWAFRDFPDRSTPPRILDIGCGAGRHAVFLAAEGFEVEAVDHSETGVAETARRLERAGLRGGTAVRAIDALDYPEASFDGAVCWGVYCYASQDRIARSIEQVALLLKPGGRFFCMTRSATDWRSKQGVEIEPGRFRLEGMEDGTPAEAEEGMVMTLLDEGSLRELFSPFSSIQVDRHVVSWLDRAYTDDDWLVRAIR